MRARLTFLSVIALLLGTAPAAVARQRAPTQTLTLVNQAHLPRRLLLRVERAIARQSISVRAHWHTPLVRWGRHGWRVVIVNRARDASLGLGPVFAGYHFAEREPMAYVSLVDPYPFWTADLDHEVIETLVNPTDRALLDGTTQEACDPVDHRTYTLDGVLLDDFVFPSWFSPTARGPYDFLRLVHRPLDVEFGY